jgi:signal transduction histidine kinase
MWGTVGLAVVLDGVALAFFLLSQRQSPAPGQLEPVFILPLLTVSLLAFPAVGAAIVTHRAWHPIGWIFISFGLLFVLSLGLIEYAVYTLFAQPGALPWGKTAAWLGNWLPVPLLYLFLLLMLLFPDGRFSSARWRTLAWITLVVTAIGTIGFAFAPQNLFPPMQALRNPGAVSGELGSLMLYATQVGGVLAGLGVVVAVGSLVVRFRRATGDERQQIKWFGFGAALLALTLALESVLPPSATASAALNLLLVLSLAALPVVAGIAILRYRLYDIDIVINRAVLLGILAIFITAVYLGIVVGAGTIVGHASTPLLSALAAAVVAIAFQPVRLAAQHLANRIVYGRRATPYDALSSFSGRVAGEYAIEEVLPRMARILAEGTGATRADVWLRQDNELRPSASWPTGSAPLSAVPLAEATQSRNDGVTLWVPVKQDDELLGALSITKRRSDPITPLESTLVNDLAAQAGLVLRNASLIEDLRMSRRRIVVAQDARAKVLERNIHDGAQQQLVALAIKARLAEKSLGRDDERARQLLIDVVGEAQEALDSLRDLAHGIFPPLLAEKGLVVALEAQARRASVPTIVEAVSVTRYSPDVEAAVYFCCLEALQNIAKYAQASSAVVRLQQMDGLLTFSVTDDGIGFEPANARNGAGTTNMIDRMEALGGRLTIDSAPGKGTTVLGRVMCEPGVAMPSAAGRGSGNGR